MGIHVTTLSSLVSGAPLGFLTASSAVALHRAWGQPWQVAFVASSYASILLLFGCLRKLEEVPHSKLQKRRQLKMAILCLAIFLNASFCHQVSKLMPPTVSAALWCLVVLVVTGALWLISFSGEVDSARHDT